MAALDSSTTVRAAGELRAKFRRQPLGTPIEGQGPSPDRVQRYQTALDTSAQEKESRLCRILEGAPDVLREVQELKALSGVKYVIVRYALGLVAEVLEGLHPVVCRDR